MRLIFKTSTFILIGVTISWITFGLSAELNTKNKNTLEEIGIFYRANELYKNPKSSEAAITQIIKEALAQNPKTSTLNLNITTVGSRVTLSGKAEDREQIQTAIQIVLSIPGVKEVISTVVVDHDIKIANKEALL
jgi:osmotically-inducible protein OsmY